MYDEGAKTNIDVPNNLKSYDKVPAALKQYPNWVCWKAENEPNGRISKKPINPMTGGYAQSNNPKTWSDFPTALRESKKYSGLGFMFSESPYFGIDLDHIEDFIVDFKSGGIKNVIAEFVFTLESYAEYSVSGKGLHIICKGSLPEGGRRKGNFEFYQDGRFFTVTGNIASQYTDVKECTESVKMLHEKYIGGAAPSTGISIPLPMNLSESEIIKLAEGSKQGDTFRRLYNGDWESLYTSQSEADLALCNMLAFWTGKDEQMMNKLFRASGLMREKWTRKQSSSTYGEITLKKAIRSCDKTYEPKPEYKVSIGKKILNGEVGETEGNHRLYSFDDTGNAERFTDIFGEKIRFNHTSKSWMYFDERKWTFDTTGSIHRMCDEVVEGMRGDMDAYVQGAEDPEKAEKDFMKHLKNSRSSKYKSAMIKESEHRLPINPDQLDINKSLLCTPNGIIDLTTGILQPHDPQKFMTKITNCEYTDKIDYPLWEKFLNEIFGGDQELIRYMQKAIGYSLTGSVKEQCLFFCYGNGQNGKSTFIETISDALGDYATNIQPETIMVKQVSNGPSGDIARLKGARFVSSAEPSQGVKLNESLVKQLTGGDKVTTSKKYEDEFEFSPEFKLWMSTNHKPVIRGTDVGIWRRIRLIPFTVTIPEGKVDKNLKFKLRQELPGIFKWMVEGCLAWQREGLKSPQSVIDATKEYKTEMDSVGSFLETCCVQGKGEETGRDLYQTFITWAKENNEYEMSNRKFGAEMMAKFESRKSNGEKIYKGISILDAYRYAGSGYEPKRASNWGDRY